MQKMIRLLLKRKNNMLVGIIAIIPIILLLIFIWACITIGK